MIGISELASSYLDKTEYDRVINTIRNLVRLSQIARRQGPLSLDNYISDLEPFLLRKGIALISDGCGDIHKKIRIIMDNLIDSSNFQGIELLEQLIIRDGVLLIQAAKSPKDLLDTISSKLGEDFRKSIKNMDLLEEIVGISELASSYLDKTEYDRVINTIRNLVRLSQIAGRQGPLSLGNYISDLEPFLLRKGIELIVDGCDDIEIKNIMDNLINSSKFEGIELLEQLIIRDGVLLIRVGERPKHLLDTISSQLGVDFCKSIENMNLLEEYNPWDHIEDEPCNDLDDADSIENVFASMVLNINQNEEMEKLVRRAGTFCIAWALIGTSRSTTKHIFNHISTSDKDEIKSIVKIIGPVRLIDVQEAQRRVINAYST